VMRVVIFEGSLCILNSITVALTSIPQH
jgi:hypothetical protein